ncbi:hypothetical protein FACS1894167_03670 [Synergistales bacterium]|nr:hypothetical protein FACS1894167_03670 [Synergistales bacterium]GHV51940.1 hypothetical protein FACS1894216_07160 [Synergistales bacterium]
MRKFSHKMLKISTACLFTLIAFIGGMWVFAPWDSFGVYAIEKARLAAAEKNVYLDYNGISVSGVLIPTYTISDVSLNSVLSKTSVSEITVRVLPLSSLLSGGLSLYVWLRSGETAIDTGHKLRHDGGRLKVTSAGDGVIFSNVSIEGDIGILGDIEYTRDGVSNNALIIKVPDNLDMMMGFAGFFERAGANEWRLKQNAAAEK